MDSSKIPVERYAAFCIVAVAVMAALYFLALPLLYASLPFALAFAAAYLCRPLAVRLHRLTHVPLGGLCVFLVFLFVVVAVLLLFFGVRAAAAELFSLAARLGEEGRLTALPEKIAAWWGDLLVRFPFLSVFSIEEGRFSAWLTKVGGAWGDYALRLAGKLAGALPGSFLFLVVSLVSAFYFARDMGKMRNLAGAWLPPRLLSALLRIKDSAFSAAMGYLRAYLLLMLLTFSMLLVGFWFLSVPYAILLSALFAVLDFLPVIGVGTVLLPWAAFCFLDGQTYLAVGLCLLYAVIALVRQIIEPKLVGAHLGIHPLLTLVAMYVGLRLFGFWGLFLFPPLCLVLRGILIPDPPKST